MSYKYVIAIVRPEAVGPLEARLRSLHIGGVTLARVQGYGDYKNFFSDDLLSEHVKVEIFTDEAEVGPLIDALCDMERADVPGAGIVAVMPVERFVHLRGRAEAAPGAPAVDAGHRTESPCCTAA